MGRWANYRHHFGQRSPPPSLTNHLILRRRHRSCPPSPALCPRNNLQNIPGNFYRRRAPATQKSLNFRRYSNRPISQMPRSSTAPSSPPQKPLSTFDSITLSFSLTLQSPHSMTPSLSSATCPKFNLPSHPIDRPSISCSLPLGMALIPLSPRFGKSSISWSPMASILTR